ncbi:hypothetical protein [Microvirga solisilvae]|uniref:hypothetical protein n=1 Tax=Microvirga solisilvae TaxID=2919498 RepID=UPI001FAF8853|nr:hypothetical protein [Microvirga solisilvae]
MNGQYPSSSKRLTAELLIGTLIGLAPLAPAYAQAPGAKTPSLAEQATTPSACSAADSELQRALEREQAYSGLIAQTLTDLMQENNELKTRLETDSSSQTTTVLDMQQALQREQELREAATRELATLQNDYRILLEARGQVPAAPSDNNAELEARLRQEQARSDDATRQLAAVTQELRALQSSKSEAAAASAHIAEMEKALAQETMRSEMLVQELSDAFGELRALREPFEPNPTPLVFRITEKGADAPLPKAEAMAQAVEPALPLIEPAAPDVTSAVPAAQPSSVVVASLPGAVQPLPAQPKPAEPVKTEDRLVIRAEELFGKGDVSGARLLLERSLAGGNPRAAFLMAETFDPNVLSRLHVLGIRGDAAKAQEFYARARDLGMAQAQERMEALK